MQPKRRCSSLRLPLLCTALLMAGCSLIPDYERPPSPSAAQYPVATQPTTNREDWHTLFNDPALKQLIETALSNNRDLRVAALNVQAFQAQYRIQRADLLPAVSANANELRQRLPSSVTGGPAQITSAYTVNLGISAYELDLFGRVRSLSEQALQSWLATEQARRSAELSLVANVASAYLTWRADQQLLELSRDTLAADEQSLHLTTRNREAGKSSALEQAQARTSVDSSRVNLARYQRLVAQDLNSLTLLVGAPVPEQLPALPLARELVSPLPAGLPSDLLQRRPDILQAEYRLKAANANIGAARAAFFPSVSLTASAGTASRDLSGLFSAGSGAWTFQPQISLPIFNAGSLRASLDYARLQKDVAVAEYEKSIQTAFQEVADGLAARSTYAQQLQAQRDLVQATQDYYNLAQNRYRNGVDSSLTFLDAQRSLFTSQQALISDRLAQLVAEVNLYTALGGGWQTEEPALR
ncbi:efflux transporter outer membrane subunit [Pseudomonas sp. NDM]|uniref:efflux transporter outer membrane subunit n=1 Tax=Pseudomonas sp. NDM TaxID=2170733 RepID=UPI00273CA485|nr:efflux transporter outer membrane subunit [Pseudomonas sp. NDM]